jgi:CspA family cold shock protein
MEQGRVKWFNAKAGYGFVTTLGEDKSEVFVHHSELKVGKEQFRYLVEGEYVEFKIKEKREGEERKEGKEVRGIRGGKLMCETRSENKEGEGEKKKSYKPKSEI